MILVVERVDHLPYNKPVQAQNSLTSWTYFCGCYHTAFSLMLEESQWS